jgi:hypothetical protein
MMVKLKVDNRRYNINGNPTVTQWMDLMRWDFEAPPHWVHIIKTVTDLPVNIIEQMTPGQQQLAVTMIAHALTVRQRVELPDFNKLTFGHFIDMEYYIALGTHKSMNQILERLDVTVEGAQQALYVTESYIKWRNNIYKQYSALFGLDDVYDDGFADSKPTDPQQTAKNWYRVLVDLANDDINQMEAVTNKVVREVFNFMAVRKEKQLAELNRQKQQKRQYDLQRARR